MTYKLEEISVNEIKFFIRRSRQSDAYQRLKDNIRRIGLKIPIGVRDISDLPEYKRKNDETGQIYKYELVKGQGRLQAYREIGHSTIPAIIYDISEAEIAGHFLTENVLRSNLSAKERAELMRFDIEAGAPVEELANKYGITQLTAKRYMRIIKGGSTELLQALEENRVGVVDAEKIATFSEGEQIAIIEILQEEEFDKDSLKDIIEKAHSLKSQLGTFGKEELKSKLRKIIEDLKITQDLLQFHNAYWYLGVWNLKKMFRNKNFAERLDKLGVDYSYFKEQE